MTNGSIEWLITHFNKRLIDTIATLNEIRIAKIASWVTVKLLTFIISTIGMNEDNKIVGMDNNIENFEASTLEILWNLLVV